MEHRDILIRAEAAGFRLDNEQAKALLSYARMIEYTNNQFNLTGHKTLQKIIDDLILGSIKPVANLTVPRGTVFIDVGTGAGIPGIPLCIYHRTWKGVLIDSIGKKILFVEKAIRECHIENCIARHARAEEFSRGNERETFDLAVSRAAGNSLVIMEISAALIKIGGLLYIYSNDVLNSFCDMLENQGMAFGLSLVPQRHFRDYGLEKEGLLFLKKEETPSIFPRRIAVMKRMVSRNDVKEIL